jgi:hypothetical protein
LSGQLPLFLPTIAGVIIAAFQVRKAEVATTVAAAQDAEADAGEGDVIDVDEVELDDPDEVDDEDEMIESEEAFEADELLEAEDASPDDAGAEPGPGPPTSGLARLRRPPTSEGQST